MHELSVCQSLLKEVNRVAVANDAVAVTQVIVAVGPLSGVEPPLLERAFTIARAGTIADQAALVVEEMAVVVWCEACGVETETRLNALTCGTCGDWQVSLRSGNELLLKRVELERAPEQAMAH